MATVAKASDNKVVKALMDGATLTGLTAGIGWGAKKVFNKSFTADPSNSFENFGMFTLALSSAIALKEWLHKEKYLPENL